ncbi:MAG: hypothetical protein ACPG5R_04675 [Cognaticolwellia aestuarii]
MFRLHMFAIVCSLCALVGCNSLPKLDPNTLGESEREVALENRTLLRQINTEVIIRRNVSLLGECLFDNRHLDNIRLSKLVIKPLSIGTGSPEDVSDILRYSQEVAGISGRDISFYFEKKPVNSSYEAEKYGAYYSPIVAKKIANDNSSFTNELLISPPVSVSKITNSTSFFSTVGGGKYMGKERMKLTVRSVIRGKDGSSQSNLISEAYYIRGNGGFSADLPFTIDGKALSIGFSSSESSNDTMHKVKKLLLAFHALKGVRAVALDKDKWSRCPISITEHKFIIPDQSCYAGEIVHICANRQAPWQRFLKSGSEQLIIQLTKQSSRNKQTILELGDVSINQLLNRECLTYRTGQNLGGKLSISLTSGVKNLMDVGDVSLLRHCEIVFPEEFGGSTKHRVTGSASILKALKRAGISRGRYGRAQ